MTDVLLDELVGYHGDPVATSLYLDVDGRRHPRWADVVARFDNLSRVAGAQAAAVGTDATIAVHDDLQQMRHWLSGLDRSSTRGIAVFSCARRGMFKAVTLPEPVRDQIAVGPSLRLAPLAAVLSAEPHALVVLIDRQRARFLRCAHGELDERGGPFDEIERAVDTDVELGSFERRHEEAVDRHVRHVAVAIEAELRDWPAGTLLVGGANESASKLVLHLRRDLPGVEVVRLPVSMTPPLNQLSNAIHDATRELDRRAAARLAADLHEKLPSDATAGLVDTLAALADRRVATLLVARGLSARGSRCRSCGALDLPHTVHCVRCGGLTDELDDVVGAAIDDAINHGADVQFCDDELDAESGIGSLTRYRATASSQQTRRP